MAVSSVAIGRVKVEPNIGLKAKGNGDGLRRAMMDWLLKSGV